MDFPLFYRFHRMWYANVRFRRLWSVSDMRPMRPVQPTLVSGGCGPGAAGPRATPTTHHRTLGPPEDDISAKNVVFRRKKISADFSSSFFSALH